jgi:hypothetical protein
MEGSVTFSRRLIPWGFDCRIEVAVTTPSTGLGPLCHALVRAFIPPECLHGGVVSDLKGRDPRLIIDPRIPPAHLPQRDELFWAFGRTPTPGEQRADVSPDKLDEPFTVGITSAFEGFSGAHHILYRAAIERYGACAEYLDIARLGHTWPLVIDRLRLGTEYFRSRRTMAFGFAPTVERTLLLEADSARILIALELERLPDRTVKTLERDDIVRSLDEILADTTGERFVTFVRHAVHPA